MGKRKTKYFKLINKTRFKKNINTTTQIDSKQESPKETRGVPQKDHVKSDLNSTQIDNEQETPEETCKSHQEDDETSNFELTIDIENAKQEEITINGNRIINFAYIYQQLQEISRHNSALGCNLSCLKLTKEIKKGFLSKFKFFCEMCHMKFEIKNCPDSAKATDLDLNDDVVSSFMSIGAGFSGLELVSACLNIPSMCDKLYAKCHTKVCRLWELAKEKIMTEAGKEEYDLAVQSGEVDSNGIPMIPVVADACWSKRSYRRNYNALSGAAVIIGYKTKKVLYMAVKNKYCMICARAQNKNVTTPEHICFKNYTGTSSGMEATALVEGFKTSVETHKLIYSRLIADGDSSTFCSIQKAKPYGNLLVEKIECTNHLLRNYSTKLEELTRNTNYPIKYRKIVGNNIARLRRSVNGAVRHIDNEDLTFEEKVLELKKDLLNAPHHVFGNHDSCKPYYCKKPNENKEKKPEENFVPAMKSQEGGFIFSAILKVLSRLVNNAKSLMHQVNSNIAETFNSVIAMFIGGKRINYSGRQSYSGRCAGSVVSFNSKQPQTFLNKKILLRSPNKLIKRLEWKRNFKRVASASRKIVKSFPTKNQKAADKHNDEDYGESCQKPDLSENDFEFAKTEHLKAISLSEADRLALERRTILQAESMEWHQERKLRLTASVFGKVCKRGLIKCGPLVKTLLSENNLEHVKSIGYGRNHEHIAREQLQSQLKEPIRLCGLFIDKDMPFLGASPDGILDENRLVEIKCPYSARDMSIEEAIEAKKILFWKKNKQGDIVLNKKHDWFYQAQGQIQICKRKTCIFAVWTNVDMKIEIIDADEPFWEEMKKKLKSFYFDCLLPELVDSRLDRKMEIKEPDFILEAINNRKKIEKKRKLKEPAKLPNQKRKKNDNEKHDSSTLAT